MSDLAVSSSLVVATLQLNLVQSVLGAIRTADLSSAAARSGGTAPLAAASAAQRPARAATQATQRTIYVRSSEKPAATFEPCRIHHWHPRLDELQPYCDNRPVQACEAKPLIQPPWRSLPWPIAEQSYSPSGHRIIKVQPGHTDVDHVGQTLDLFV